MIVFSCFFIADGVPISSMILMRFRLFVLSLCRFAFYTINTMVFATLEGKILQFFFGVIGGDPNAGMRQKNTFSRRFCLVENFLTRIGPTPGRPRADRVPTAMPLSPKSGSLADTKSRYQTISITGGQ